MSKGGPITKFMDGRMTPNEAHRALGIRKKCAGCGRPAAIRIRVLADLKELTKQQPQFVAAIAASNPAGPFVPVVPTKYGPMVMLSDIGACDLCRKTAEVTAAQSPSWCIIDIDRGPNERNKVVAQVPKGDS